jgi:hypothetical protein
MKYALLFILLPAAGRAGEVPLPPRAAEARDGAALAAAMHGLPLHAREALAVQEFAAGNVPDRWRKFAAVTVTHAAHSLTFYAAPDVLMLGRDGDSFRLPLTPPAAQAALEAAGCLLPTRKMVDAIAAAAELRIEPAPLPPGPDMVTFSKFMEHDRIVDALLPPEGGGLMAGAKKDVVLSPATPAGKVAIYGWHRKDGRVIQPLYSGHTESWVDYSHGIRAVQRRMMLDGRETDAAEVLAHPVLSALLSDEGPVFQSRPDTGRTTVSLALPHARLVIKTPPVLPPGPLTVALYATPNGNTAEQTEGRAKVPGDDWHYHIQNIGAQTRWLRRHGLPGLIVVYAEAEGLSWPAWRKKYGDAALPRVLDILRAQWPGRELRFVLTGHSGGGAFTFGLLDAWTAIPPEVQTIAFLDSNYAYSADKGHTTKLASWLHAAPDHTLSVLAYHDSHALLHGKPFVSESGGTWGRSHAMMDGLAPLLPDFRRTEDTAAITAAALQHRVTFRLLKNPERKVLHTVLVERNGFIHALMPDANPESSAVQE